MQKLKLSEQTYITYEKWTLYKHSFTSTHQRYNVHDMPIVQETKEDQGRDRWTISTKTVLVLAGLCQLQKELLTTKALAHLWCTIWEANTRWHNHCYYSLHFMRAVLSVVSSQTNTSSSTSWSDCNQITNFLTGMWGLRGSWSANVSVLFQLDWSMCVRSPLHKVPVSPNRYDDERGTDHCSYSHTRHYISPSKVCGKAWTLYHSSMNVHRQLISQSPSVQTCKTKHGRRKEQMQMT